MPMSLSSLSVGLVLMRLHLYATATCCRGCFSAKAVGQAADLQASLLSHRNGAVQARVLQLVLSSVVQSAERHRQGDAGQAEALLFDLATVKVAVRAMGPARHLQVWQTLVPLVLREGALRLMSQLPGLVSLKVPQVQGKEGHCGGHINHAGKARRCGGCHCHLPMPSSDVLQCKAACMNLRLVIGHAACMTCGLNSSEMLVMLVVTKGCLLECCLHILHILRVGPLTGMGEVTALVVELLARITEAGTTIKQALCSVLASVAQQQVSLAVALNMLAALTAGQSQAQLGRGHAAGEIGNEGSSQGLALPGSNMAAVLSTLLPQAGISLSDSRPEGAAGSARQGHGAGSASDIGGGLAWPQEFWAVMQALACQPQPQVRLAVAQHLSKLLVDENVVPQPGQAGPLMSLVFCQLTDRSAKAQEAWKKLLLSLPNQGLLGMQSAEERQIVGPVPAWQHDLALSSQQLRLPQAQLTALLDTLGLKPGSSGQGLVWELLGRAAPVGDPGLELPTPG